MKIEPGMKFKGNKNGRMIEVIQIENGFVKCRDLKYGAVFSVGRAMFERCDITLIEQNEDS